MLRSGRFDQRVGEHELRAAHIGKRQRDLAAILEPQPRMILVGAEHDAGEPLAPVERHVQLDPREMAGEAVPVLHAGERPVDAGRAHLERPGAGDRVVHVEHGAHRVADRLAILDADQRAVGAVGHDLHGRALAAEDRDAHELVAHVGEGRRDEIGDFRFKPRMARLLWFQNKKGGPRRPPPVTQRRMIVVAR